MIFKLNTEFHKKVSKAYEEMKHEPDKLEVKNAYSALIMEMDTLYNKILEKDYIRIAWDKKPYKNVNEMIKDSLDINNLRLLSSSAGFGSLGNEFPDNPLLDESGYFLQGRPLLWNDIFRVLHDIYGHIIWGFGFDAVGEENAYRAHCGQFSRLAIKALTTETRGQSSWVNFGPYAGSKPTIYADQKIGILPNFCFEIY